MFPVKSNTALMMTSMIIILENIPRIIPRNMWFPSGAATPLNIPWNLISTFLPSWKLSYPTWLKNVKDGPWTEGLQNNRCEKSRDIFLTTTTLFWIKVGSSDSGKNVQIPNTWINVISIDFITTIYHTNLLLNIIQLPTALCQWQCLCQSLYVIV